MVVPILFILGGLLPVLAAGDDDEDGRALVRARSVRLSSVKAELRPAAAWQMARLLIATRNNAEGIEYLRQYPPPQRLAAHLASAMFARGDCADGRVLLELVPSTKLRAMAVMEAAKTSRSSRLLRSDWLEPLLMDDEKSIRALLEHIHGRMGFCQRDELRPLPPALAAAPVDVGALSEHVIPYVLVYLWLERRYTEGTALVRHLRGGHGDVALEAFEVGLLYDQVTLCVELLSAISDDDDVTRATKQLILRVPRADAPNLLHTLYDALESNTHISSERRAATTIVAAYAMANASAGSEMLRKIAPKDKWRLVQEVCEYVSPATMHARRDLCDQAVASFQDIERQLSSAERVEAACALSDLCISCGRTDQSKVWLNLARENAGTFAPSATTYTEFNSESIWIPVAEAMMRRGRIDDHDDVWKGVERAKMFFVNHLADTGAPEYQLRLRLARLMVKQKGCYAAIVAASKYPGSLGIVPDLARVLGAGCSSIAECDIMIAAWDDEATRAEFEVYLLSALIEQQLGLPMSGRGEREWPSEWQYGAIR